MRKYIFSILLFLTTVIAIFNIDQITSTLAVMLDNEPVVVTSPPNEYTKDYDFQFVRNTTNFRPFSYNDILNIYFTVINNGWDRFTFYCPSEYVECINDIKIIANDDTLLSHINNFVHPFNSFQYIQTSYTESGEVTIRITRLYTKEQINRINEFVDEKLAELINDEMTYKEKIKAIHDYIILNTDYDEIKNKEGSSPWASNTAYGVFFQQYGVCSGFSDAMAIFLGRLGLRNFKIASNTHVWNAVFVDNGWYHIDVTWNNPVSPDGRKTLWHKYMLIKTPELMALSPEGDEDHLFDRSIYLEMR